MVENTKSKVGYIWNNFKRVFPDYTKRVISYNKKGSRCISLEMDDGQTLYFMYYTPTNWNLGTKPWREKPKKIRDKEQKTQDLPMIAGLDLCHDCTFKAEGGKVCTLPIGEECTGPVTR